MAAVTGITLCRGIATKGYYLRFFILKSNSDDGQDASDHRCVSFHTTFITAELIES
jgi:hypothetical protein